MLRIHVGRYAAVNFPFIPRHLSQCARCSTVTAYSAMPCPGL